MLSPTLIGAAARLHFMAPAQLWLRAKGLPGLMLASIKKLIGGDGHQAEVMRGAATAFVLRGIGAGLAFVLNVAIGRLLGAEGAGLYFLALSIVTIVTVLTRFGMDNSLLRFIASSVALDQWTRARGVYRLGMRTVALASAAAGVLIVLAGPLIARLWMDKPDLGDVLQIMGLGTLGLAVMMAGAECLKGLKRIAPAVAVSSIIFPLVALALIWPLTERFGPAGAAGAYAAGVSIAALAGWLWWRYFTAAHADQEPEFVWAELWDSCRPLWLMSIITKAIMPWSPLLILGFFAASDDVGVYGAATRIAMLVTFLLISVNTVISPKFAELHAKGDIAALARLARRFALLITLVTSPLFLLLIVAGETVMTLFGPEFARGGAALAILAMGQAVNALTGSAGALLMMTGHERDIRNASIWAGLLAVTLSLVLIPLYGLIGAAISTAVSIAAMNLISIAMIKKRLGINVMPWAKD